MTEFEAAKISEFFWKQIGNNDTWYDHSIEDLELMLNNIEKFQSKLPKTYSSLYTDCVAQKTLIIMRQNYLATGKYL